MQKMDEIDKKIMFEIDKNSRRSINEISKILKLKKDTVAYRIKQLEDNKIIQGYYTVIDYSKLGYILLRYYVKFQNTTLELEEEIINHLVNSKSIFTVYKTEGDWDLALGFLVKSLEEFNNILIYFQEKYKKYMHSHNVAIFIEYIQYLKNYLVEEKLRDHSGIIIGKSQKTEIDELDIKILKEISKNAKFSLIELSKKLNLSSMALIYRIKQLEKKKVILSYKALIDYTKLNYEYYKIDLDIEDITKLKQLQQFAKNHPNIIFEDRTIGSSDFEFDAELQGYDAFYNLIKEIKIKFPGILRTYKYYKAKKIYKYIYFPEE